MIRSLTLGDLADGAYNPWATTKHRGVSGPFHYDHRVQAKWAGDVPIVLRECGISFMPFDRDAQENSLATLRKDRLQYLTATRTKAAASIDEKLRDIESTERELRLLSHLRETIAQNYKSYEETRDKYKNELRVMEARLRAFKYEEDTLREFDE